MSSLLASIHYLALAIGVSGLLIRIIGLKEINENQLSLKQVYFGDNLYGIAAVLWIITGVFRLIGPYDKGTAFYMHNPWFHTKLTIFFIVFLLEIIPMKTLIQWRFMKIKIADKELFSKIKLMKKLSSAELALLLVIPFLASAMARWGI